MITLRISDAKIVNGEVIISKFTIFKDGNPLREAEVNEGLLSMLKEIEIDLAKYSDIKSLLKRNPSLKLLIQKFDLCLDT